MRRDHRAGCDAARSRRAGATTTSNGSLPRRKPSSARYVVEIRDTAGTSLLLTSADWTAKERDADEQAEALALCHEATRAVREYLLKTWPADRM
jgi:hypothetical protein